MIESAGYSVIPTNGKADVAVWRPATGVWYIHRSAGGDSFNSYGANGYIPLPLAPAIRLLFFGP